jgi:hypothetical protein
MLFCISWKQMYLYDQHLIIWKDAGASLISTPDYLVRPINRLTLKFNTWFPFKIYKQKYRIYLAIFKAPGDKNVQYEIYTRTPKMANQNDAFIRYDILIGCVNNPQWKYLWPQVLAILTVKLTNVLHYSLWALNAIFKNISGIAWRSVLHYWGDLNNRRKPPTFSS